jgi:hypothetical protein
MLMGPPGWGSDVGLTTPHSKKLVVTKVEQRNRYCSTGQSPQQAVAPTEEEEEENNITKWKVMTEFAKVSGLLKSTVQVLLEVLV